MEIEDKTGQPRSNDDLKDALEVVEDTAVEDILKMPPRLAVFLPTIREALKELLDIKEHIGLLKKVDKDVLVTNETSTNDGKVQTESQKFIAD